MKSNRQNKTPCNFGQRNGALNKSSTATKVIADVVNLNPNSQKSKRYVQVSYVDKRGIPKTITIHGNRAYILVFIWRWSTSGLTQKDIPQGFTLKDYVYTLATCFKATFYMEFKREDEPNRYGSHRRYWLETELTFIDEQGFPEIRKFIKS